MSSSRPPIPSGDDDFNQARTYQVLHAVGAMIRLQPANLLSLEAVRSRVLVRGQQDLGLRMVRLDHIVGSESRTLDFDSHFLPRTSRTRDRWKSIVRAVYEGRSLPPISVYKIGSVYFVRDGHHRVSVARQRGQVEIEASVIGLKTDVPLRINMTARDLVHIEEQSDFMEWTNLAQVRCSITIEVSKLGGYLDLISHINRHRNALSDSREQPVDRDEATAHWYDTLYTPVVQRIRQSTVMQRLRGTTEADIFLAILQLQQAESERGTSLTLEQAAEQYLAKFSKQTRLGRLLPWHWF